MKLKNLLLNTAVILVWILLTTLCAAAYGALNDQITVTISPEYYSLFKHWQFQEALQKLGLIHAPLRIQAAAVGVLATWWYGLFLGIMLGISSMVGRQKRLSTKHFFALVGRVMLVTISVSAICGAIAYAVQPVAKPSAYQWCSAAGDIRRMMFCVGWWHNGAYLAALPATFWACFRAQKQRRTSALAQPKQTLSNYLTF